MPDLKNGKIYKIVCHETDEVYYGSTVQTLSDRISSHKKDKTCMARQIIERGNYSIVLIKDFPCNSKQELEREEGIYIRNNECINKKVAGRTYQEFKKDNPEIVKMWSRKDYEKHKDNYIKRARIWQEKNKHTDKFKESRKRTVEKRKKKVTCECGCVVSKAYLSTHKKSKKHLEYLQTLD